MTSIALTIDRSVRPARLDFAPDFNAASWFIDRHLAEGRGGRIAIREAGPGGGGRAGALAEPGGARTGPRREVTYAELADRVGRAGNALLGLGLAPGDRILMVMVDSAEFFYVFWGAMKAGIVPIPVNGLLRADDLAFMIDDAGVKAVAYSPAFASEVVPALAASTSGAQGLVVDDDGGLISRLGEASPNLETMPAGPEETAFWLYSSGTTGRPKGVPHRHRAAPATCEHYAVGVLGLDGEDACFSAAKLFFAYGLGNAMTFPLHVGGTAVLDERRPTAATTFETISGLRPTAFFGVPTLYAAQLQRLEGGRDPDRVTGAPPPPDLASLRICVSAGEALPADLLRRWKETTGLEILDGIGSTEALHIFISNRIGAVVPGTTGQPVPGYEARVVDDEGALAPDGEPGELEIRGGSITPGYWNRPERNASTLIDGWLRTGDQYIRDEEGYFRFLGRADDMIKVGGIWCSPFDIEARLIEHPAVLEAAVVGRADGDGLIKPEAWVVLAPPATEGLAWAAGQDEAESLESELVRHCQDGLPRYMYPRWIRFVEELPKTATGKIQRFKLRQT